MFICYVPTILAGKRRFSVSGLGCTLWIDSCWMFVYHCCNNGKFKKTIGRWRTMGVLFGPGVVGEDRGSHQSAAIFWINFPEWGFVD